MHHFHVSHLHLLVLKSLHCLSWMCRVINIYIIFLFEYRNLHSLPQSCFLSTKPLWGRVSLHKCDFAPGINALICTSPEDILPICLANSSLCKGGIEALLFHLESTKLGWGSSKIHPNFIYDLLHHSHNPSPELPFLALCYLEPVDYISTSLVASLLLCGGCVHSGLRTKEKPHHFTATDVKASHLTSLQP